jgi:succinyl-CoA synthetase alpha subunit
MKMFQSPPNMSAVARESTKENESRNAVVKGMGSQELHRPVNVGFEPGKLYTTGQVADVTGLSTKAFEAWRLKGAGGPAFIKLGGRVRYQGEDLLAWIAANRRSSTSEG